MDTSPSPFASRRAPHTSAAGFTLSELLVCLLLASTLAIAATSTLSRFAAEQRLISASNDLLTLMRLARAEAMTSGPILLCDHNHACTRFETTQNLAVLRASNTPPHMEPEAGRPPLALLTLPPDVHVSWRRFRGSALLFHRNGILHFQNGHFLICNRHASRRIVMNWAGRPRVESGGSAAPCP